MTDPQIAALHVRFMSEMLHYWNYLYYHCAVSIVTDYQYDRLLRALQIIEKKFPELVKPLSPTQTIGWNPEAFSEVEALKYDKQEAIVFFLYPEFIPPKWDDHDPHSPKNWEI